MNGEGAITEVLDHLPKKTPPWAVGLVTIMITLAVTFSGIYILSRDDVRQFIGWAEQHHTASDAAELAEHEAVDNARAKSYDAALQTVTSLINSNAAQIVELAKSLGMTQQQNLVLTDRVSALEQSLHSVEKNLIDCEGRLSKCQSSK